MKNIILINFYSLIQVSAGEAEATGRDGSAAGEDRGDTIRRRESAAEGVVKLGLFQPVCTADEKPASCVS